MSTKTKKQPSQKDHESSVVAAAATKWETYGAMAQAIAMAQFGAASNEFAVDEICDYLEIVGDPDDFVPDLKRIYAHAQKAYQTLTPSPERVFALFDDIYEEE